MAASGVVSLVANPEVNGDLSTIRAVSSFPHTIPRIVTAVIGGNIAVKSRSKVVAGSWRRVLEGLV
jgi:hypothetical protein